MDQHGLHAERVGDEAGVLAAGAAEAVEQIFGDVVAALHRDLLDGVGHVLDGDGDEALGDRFGRAAVADLCGQGGETLAHHRGVERLVLAGAEDRREEIGLQLAEHDVGVGDGERAAAPVAGGTGIGAGRIRPGLEAPGLEMQDRAAAGGDGVDAHHRRADAHAGDLGVEGALVVAVVMGDVGRGAAHVEADDLAEAGELCASRPCRRRRRPGRTAARPCPGRCSAAVRPPDDIMNMRRGPSSSAISPLVGEMPGRAEGGVRE